MAQPDGGPQIGGHQAAEALLVPLVEVMLDVRLVRIEEAEQGGALLLGLFGQEIFPFALQPGEQRFQVGWHQAVQGVGQGVEELFDAASLDGFDFPAGQAPFDPAAQLQELLLGRQVRRGHRLAGLLSLDPAVGSRPEQTRLGESFGLQVPQQVLIGPQSLFVGQAAVPFVEDEGEGSAAALLPE